MSKTQELFSTKLTASNTFFNSLLVMVHPLLPKTVNAMSPNFNNPNRREFIAIAGAGLGALALRGYAAIDDLAAHFSHGVASGDPLTDRVILWTRVLPGSGNDEVLKVNWQVATDENFATVVSQGNTTTQAQQDYTVKVDAAGLQPGRQYYYRFICNAQTSPTGTTRTLPADNVDSINLAVVSCSNYPQGFFHVYNEIAQRPVDAVLHLGDYIYEYAEGVYADPAIIAKGRGVEPSHEIVALEDYRMRYGLYRTDKNLQAVHRAHPFICVWDDHEIADNTWKTGAVNHNPGEGLFSARRQAAIQAFYEWLPIREPSHGDRDRIYRRFDFGKLASLILLDTRLIGRDEQLTHALDVDTLKTELANPKRSILGVEQEQWLTTQLQQSKQQNIPWQIIGQQVLIGKLGIPQIADDQLDATQSEMVASGRYAMLRERGKQGLLLNLDAWDGYPECRKRVYQAFREHGNNVIVLAGDTHSSWAFELSDEDNSKPLAVEYGTPSITSPGFENLLPVNTATLEQATKDVSPELKYFDAAGRGWMEVAVDHSQCTTRFYYVSSVKTESYAVADGPKLVTKLNEHSIGQG